MAVFHDHLLAFTRRRLLASFVFPIVFLLTFMAATRQQPFLIMSPGMRTSWLVAHISLIFTGYAALVLSFCASLLYLVQQHSLKAKRSNGILSRLPALEGYRPDRLSLSAARLPFMTLGPGGRLPWFAESTTAGVVISRTRKSCCRC